MWIFLTYIVIGIITSIIIWRKYYSEEYYKAKSNANIEDGMVSIFLIIMILFWPLFIIGKLTKII